MGILDFSEFLKKHAPNCYFEYALESFRGKRIAVDIHSTIYKMMFGAIADVVERTNIAQEKPDINEIERKTLDMILNRLEILLYYGITPVCVFDGKPHPMKQKTQSKRRAAREKAREKLLEAETRLYSVDPLFRSQPLVNEYKKCYKNNIEARWEFVSQLKDVLASSGFPVVSAEDLNLETRDAEGICAALCMPGNEYCFATISEDSDYHVYGGNIELVDIYPRYVTKGETRSTVYYAKVRCLESILAGSGLNFNQFRDLCIMLGTDYNPRIYNVGLKKCWDYITGYGSIAGVSTVLDVSTLCYPEVLKIFSSPITKLDFAEPLIFNETRFREHGRQIFDTYGMKDHTGTILNLLSMIATQKVTREPVVTNSEPGISGTLEL